MARDAGTALLDAAEAVFAEEGFRAVGIDRLLEVSGVSRMTLYNRFGSKEGLIVAMLRRVDERTRASLRRFVRESGGDDRVRLMSAVRFFCVRMASESFGGCVFLNACGSFQDEGCAVRRAASEHKRLVLEYLEALASSAGADSPGELAGRLMVVIDGVLAHAGWCGGVGAGVDRGCVAARAVEAAEAVVEAGLGR